MGRPKLIGPLTASETKKKEARARWYQEHRELTKKRALEHKRRDQEWFRSIKSQESCADCGHDVYEDLDYHHIDPSTKITTVSDMVGRYGRERILQEIDKCIVVCKTCHKTYH